MEEEGAGPKVSLGMGGCKVGSLLSLFHPLVIFGFSVWDDVIYREHMTCHCEQLRKKKKLSVDFSLLK